MRVKGFTLTEMLVVISIIILVSVLSYPVIISSKRQANRTVCLTNLKQIGVSIALYRERYNGAEVGTPQQMGLPFDYLSTFDHYVPLICKGNYGEKNGYYQNYPAVFDSEKSKLAWLNHVSRVGSDAVTWFDPSHEDQYPRSFGWDTWRVYGVRLDTSIKTRTRMGFPINFLWWER